jgi:hypothetical protein
MRIHKAQVGLVHQRRCLQAVIRTLARDVALGNAMELSVYERDQPLESALVALPPFQEQPGDLRWVVWNGSSLGHLAVGCSRNERRAQLPRTLIARDITATIMISEMALSSIISIFARDVSGTTSVVLNAVAVE